MSKPYEWLRDRKQTWRERIYYPCWRVLWSGYRWFGLHHDTPMLNGLSATYLNDVDKVSFKRIAQEIRKEFNIEKEKK